MYTGLLSHFRGVYATESGCCFCSSGWKNQQSSFRAVEKKQKTRDAFLLRVSLRQKDGHSQSTPLGSSSDIYL